MRESVLAPEAVSYRGRPSGARLRLAFCRASDFEIELVQVLAGDWPTADHIRRHGPGLHHVRFVVDDLAATIAEMEASGFGEALRGVSPRGSHFAYLEAADILGATMVELIQPAPDTDSTPPRASS